MDPKDQLYVSVPTWGKFEGCGVGRKEEEQLAVGTTYTLHKAAQEPNCCLLVLAGGWLLLLQCPEEAVRG